MDFCGKKNETVENFDKVLHIQQADKKSINFVDTRKFY